MKTLSKSRDLSFDVTRVVCTLWIVGHMAFDELHPESSACCSDYRNRGACYHYGTLLLYVHLGVFPPEISVPRQGRRPHFLPETIFPVLRLIFSFGDHLADRRLFHGQVLV